VPQPSSLLFHSLLPLGRERERERERGRGEREKEERWGRKGSDT
jgi:hypothetical protein